MKTKTILIAVSFFVAMLVFGSSVRATTDTIGGVSAVSSGFTYIFASKIQANASGTLQTIGINIFSNGGDNVIVGLYSDNVGMPDTLLSQSSSTALIDGWNDLPVSATLITAGNYYWLAGQTDTGVGQVYLDSGLPLGSAEYATRTYSPFPNTYPASTPSSFIVNMRMTYNVVTTTTAPSGNFTTQYCQDGTTLIRLTYVNLTVLNAPIPNSTRVILVKNPVTCDFGCDQVNQVCNPNPTQQNFVFLAVISSIIFVVIFVVWLVKWRR
jgi:hypothetical protein